MWAGANRPDTDGIDLGQALSTKKEFTLPSIWNPSIASVHSEHHVLTRPEPGRLAYTMTGIAMVADGVGSGQVWSQHTVNWTVHLPGLAPGKKLALVHWAPFVALSSISNDNAATNAGWAVDSFRVTGTEQPQTYVVVQADLAIRDADGWILRLAYSLHLLGEEV